MRRYSEKKREREKRRVSSLAKVSASRLCLFNPANSRDIDADDRGTIRRTARGSRFGSASAVFLHYGVSDIRDIREPGKRAEG